MWCACECGDVCVLLNRIKCVELVCALGFEWFDREADACTLEYKLILNLSSVSFRFQALVSILNSTYPVRLFFFFAPKCACKHHQQQMTIKLKRLFNIFRLLLNFIIIIFFLRRCPCVVTTAIKLEFMNSDNFFCSTIICHIATVFIYIIQIVCLFIWFDFIWNFILFFFSFLVCVATLKQWN